jgi:urea transport system substrate-binding protein
VQEENSAKTMITDGETSSATPAVDRNDESASQLWVGHTLGKYQITEFLGSGAMGVVYKAHDATIERDVAIKILPRALSAHQTTLQRFLAEAKAAGKLSHPNVVTIHEIAHEAETHYIVMEVVSGGCIADRLERQGSFSVLEATQIISDACNGLTAAHAVGLIHRDVKPANLLRAQDGTVKVADFGLAKGAVDSSLQLTQAGQVVGTPYFMSPEQCESRTGDHRSDIYSLGATYYSLLSGENPYDGAGSTVQVMYAHCHSEIPDPRKLNRAIPDACAAIIARAMAKQPEDRYQSAEAMLADLNAVTATLSATAQIALPSQSGTTSALSSATSAAPPSKTPRLPRWLTVGFPAVILAAVVFAVVQYFPRGSSSEQNSSTGTDPAVGPSAAIPPSGESIKVGILHSLTGTMADSESAVVDATLLAIEELNNSGGILGRPIEAVVRDGRSDSPVFARETKRLIKEDAVCTVFGCWTSASRKTVVPIFEEHDHLLVYPVQYEGIEESPNVIYTGASPNQQIIPAVKWAFAFLNKRRFFLVGSDYVFPRTANEIIKDNLNELGAELAGEEYVALGSSHVREIVSKIVDTKPDVILNTINGDSNVAFFSELRAAGIKPETISTISFSIGEEELRHLNVSDMVGDFAAWNYFQSLDSPENEQFVETFKRKYGPQRVVTDPMEAAYFGVKLWAQAVKEANSDDVSEIRRAMRNQRLYGPGGYVRIDPATQHTFKTPRIGKIRADGQFEVVWTAAEPVHPTPFPRSRTTAEWKAFLHDLYTGWGEQWAAPIDVR